MKTDTRKQVEIRDIAKMFAKALPIDGEAFGDRVNSYVEEIKKLPVNARLALRSAYIFASRVPREEQQDLFQEFALTVLKARVNDEKLAYAIVRCDWLDFWRDYKRQAELGSTVSIYNEVTDSDGNTVELGDLLVGECDFEFKIDGKLDSERLWSRLPEEIKAIVEKRLLQQPINREERNKLAYFARTHAFLNT